MTGGVTREQLETLLRLRRAQLESATVADEGEDELQLRRLEVEALEGLLDELDQAAEKQAQHQRVYRDAMIASGEVADPAPDPFQREQMRIAEQRAAEGPEARAQRQDAEHQERRSALPEGWRELEDDLYRTSIADRAAGNLSGRFR